MSPTTLHALYEATATFDFATSAAENLSLDLLSDNVAGVGFNSLQLQLVSDGHSHTYSFTSPTGSAGAEPFFSAHDVDIGPISEGCQSVSLNYILGYSSASAGAGFGFAYEFKTSPTPTAAALDLRTPGPGPAVPELPTWAMLSIAFALLGCGHYARKSRSASFSTNA